MTKDVYGAQSYRKTGKGYERAAFVACDNEDDAYSEAEKLAAKRGVSGAIAFLRSNYSKEFAEGDDPITLAAFGDVPPEARDVVPF